MVKDPEVKSTTGDQKFATFTLATNRYWKDPAGVKQEETEYHRIIVWRHLADLVEQYVKKGKKLYIQGYNKTRSWDREDGTKAYATEVVGENVIFLDNAGV